MFFFFFLSLSTQFMINRQSINCQIKVIVCHVIHGLECCKNDVIYIDMQISRVELWKYEGSRAHRQANVTGFF